MPKIAYTYKDAENMPSVPLGLFGCSTVANLSVGASAENPGEGVGQRIFTGHEYDSDTSLIYMGARYYTGDAGKFLSEDPLFLDMGGSLKRYGKKTNEILVNPQSLNSYSYVTNRPLVYTDPNGETEWWAWWLNPGGTASQVAFWKATSGVLSATGNRTASSLVSQSLKLNTGNLDIVATSDSKYSYMVNEVENHPDFQKYINNLITKAEGNNLSTINDIQKDNLGITFNTGDLGKALHGTKLTTVTGQQATNGQWNLNVSIHDIFDFDTFQTNLSSSGSAVGTIGNNLGLVSQNMGAMSSFNVDINFSYSAKSTSANP
ncbi:RHS repeat-associated core domain-containing protein [Candidatus Falkowbacteria bacterium]|nr:RHS repeat-associated core domain-containing protein [Candidatus Falkowbacteria bacterium]